MASADIAWCLVTKQFVIPTALALARKVGQISLRTLHYNLVSREIIPNTRSAYNKLSTVVRDARKDGSIPWRIITDETRHTIARFHDYYVSPEEAVDFRIDYLDTIHKKYLDDILYKGYKQKYYIEIWLEKNALVSTFKTFLGKRHIRIVPNRGYSSWTYAYENCKRLSEMQNEIDMDTDSNGIVTRQDSIEKEIIILYYGDYDPSGDDMDNTLGSMLEYFKRYFRLKNVTFKRVAIKLEHIRKFNLPSKPTDQQTLEKLERDRRTVKFVSQHNGVLYAVELDALLAYVPDEFEKMVQESVDEYYDSKIYDELLSREQHKPEHIRCLVTEKVRSWLRRMEDEGQIEHNV